MFGSEILDVAIGLIMMFLLVSLICSSIKEAFETVLNHRAKDLERGLREMLGDIKGEGVVPALYKHPLIDGLFKGEYVAGKTRNLPSYIPARTFALAFIDLLAQSRALAPQQVGAPGTQAHVKPTLQMFEDAVTALPADSKLRGSLMPIIAVARYDAVKLQNEIERWYDSAMDRVSGWYKKRTQYMLAFIGINLAIAMNIDTVAIVRYLNTSQTAREVMISRVKSYEDAHAKAVAGTPGSDPQAGLDMKQSSELTDPMGFLERQGGLPLGWISTPMMGQSDVDYQHDWRRVPRGPSAWLFKIAGILLTGFAVTLGAPFWFDVLNRFMVVRSTVKPDEKSPNEKSKS